MTYSHAAVSRRGKGYPSILDASIDAPLSITQTTPIADPAAQNTRGLPSMEPGTKGAGISPPTPSGNVTTVV